MENLIREIFTIYHKDVYLYLYSLTHDAHLSEDLTGEVFLELLKAVKSFRQECDVKTFLFSIARHRWFNYLRKNKKYADHELLSEFTESRDNIEEDIFYKELKDRLESILSQEKERDREVVNLRIERLSFHEIGTKVGISENSARVIFFRLKNKIKEILQKEGYYGI